MCPFSKFLNLGVVLGTPEFVASSSEVRVTLGILEVAIGVCSEGNLMGNVPSVCAVCPNFLMTIQQKKGTNYWSSLVTQWIEDPALSLLWLWLQQWCGLNPWPKNFCMPMVQPKKERNKLLINAFFLIIFLGSHPWHMEVPRQARERRGAVAASLYHRQSS